MAVLILGIPLAIGCVAACFIGWWKWNAEMADRKNKEIAK